MIHMIGNAHIDPVWLWQWRDGYHEVKATFQSALDRLNESDDFVFTSACAAYYRWVRDNAPAMFEQIRARVKEGRWKIVGGMWVQPDINMPSGESIARHLLYSQRFFQDEFGVTVKTGYNVDSFGQGGNLPALLSRGGIENYVFQRPGIHENAEIPGPLFKWFSNDGSSVNTYRIDGYGSRYGGLEKNMEKALEDEDRFGYPLMCYYGVGNHGGGPTVKNIASIHAFQKDGKRGGEIIFSDPDTYFEEIRKLDLKLPEWHFECQHHASGCYSATSLIKRLNRRTENALIRCEFFGALADKLTDHKLDDLSQAWRNLMFNQFHDVMCGCSIREAYDDAELQHHEAQNIADRAENAALQKISWNIDTVQGIPGRIRSKESHFALWELDGLGTPVVVFNPHAYEVEAPVQFYGGVAHCTDENDEEQPVQVIRASRTNNEDKWDSVFTAKVPALGYRLYWVYLDEKGTPSHGSKVCTPEDNSKELIAASGLKVTEHTIENNSLSAVFDPATGALVSLKRKDTGREVLAGPAMPKLVDVTHIDTWAHMVFKFDRAVAAFGAPEFKVLEVGPVRAKLRVITRVLDSTLIQEYTLYAGSDQLEVHVRLDMQEKHRMLKLCFPVAGTELKTRAEISYGVIERPTDGCEEHCHRWVELGGNEGGLGLINDSKYSYSADGNELRFTIAHTSIFADHYGQEYRDDRCIHMDIGWQELSYALVPYDGAINTADLQRRGEIFNRALPNIVETYHEGSLPAKYEGLKVTNANISAGALKRAEDGDAYILRLEETAGIATKAVIEAPMFSRTIELDIAPWAIETVRIPDDPAQAVTKTNFIER